MVKEISVDSIYILCRNCPGNSIRSNRVVNDLFAKVLSGSSVFWTTPQLRVGLVFSNCSLSKNSFWSGAHTRYGPSKVSRSDSTILQIFSNKPIATGMRRSYNSKRHLWKCAASGTTRESHPRCLWRQGPCGWFPSVSVGNSSSSPHDWHSVTHG